MSSTWSTRTERLQTRFSMQLRVYVSGHEWLASQLTWHGIRYTRQDISFRWIAHFPGAQRRSAAPWWPWELLRLPSPVMNVSATQEHKALPV